ncbi:MAG: hypothetical protein SFX73_16890 [Kofleriaceae bacterium]|nr:hypothetical protein [Kofleriaceae bacterium]
MRSSIEAQSPEPTRVDRVVVIVVGALFVFHCFRVLLPALLAGEQVGASVATAGALLVCLALAVLPALVSRRRGHDLGDL